MTSLASWAITVGTCVFLALYVQPCDVARADRVEVRAL